MMVEKLVGYSANKQIKCTIVLPNRGIGRDNKITK